MEVREVKFNLKNFIEDFVFAIESKDSLSRECLEDSFESEYKKSSLVIQEGIEKFIFRSKIASEYPSLQDFVLSCSRNFKK